MEFTKVALFHNLDPTALDEIQASARVVNMPKDNFLFLQDDPAERMYLLLSGRVKIGQLSVDGQQVILRVANAGQVVGIVAMTGSHFTTYPVFAQVVEDVQALVWQAGELTSLQLKYPQLAINSARHMASQIREFQELLRQLATERVEQRIARLLLRLARQLGQKTGAGVWINFPLSRQDLAEMSGTTLYTVSRTLSKWERDGLVKVGRERVVITQPHQLVILAEDIK